MNDTFNPRTNIDKNDLLSDSSPVYTVPFAARASHDIPRPSVWQQLQSRCIILFREELKDPNTIEYGRNGQKQDGIDIIGRRNANPNHYVGIQCRLITAPIKYAKILKDCRDALALEAGLKEIIFATTAENDTGATKAAAAVEKLLRSEGYELTVTVYGWGNLQTLIQQHEAAYNAFFPQAIALTNRVPTAVQAVAADASAINAIAQAVAEQMRGSLSVGLAVQDKASGSQTDEDPALHAKIDIFRDLLKEREPTMALRRLQELKDKEQLDQKPWARFRIETNLGAATLDLGREPDGAAHFEAAYAMRPGDTNAIANLALARTIQGRFDEAMQLAQEALAADPPCNGAVAYLLQAAARSAWQGDPNSLVPEHLRNSAEADLGLAEFLRRRETPGWEQRSLELADAHPDSHDFKRIRGIAVLSLLIAAGATVPGGRGPISTEQLSAAATDMKEWAEHCLKIGYADRADLFAYLNNAAVLLRIAGRFAECEALLQQGISFAPEEAQFRRLLAVSLVTRGKGEDARKTLAGDTDPENRLLAADILAHTDIAAALAETQAVPPDELDDRLTGVRWRMLAEMAIVLNNEAVLREAVEGLRTQDDITAQFMELRWERQQGAKKRAVRRKARGLIARMPSDANPVSRYLWATELRDIGLYADAAKLIEPVVDLAVPSAATTLYLQSLAAARRDSVLQRALAEASPTTLADPDILWMRATHAWNTGDLPEAKRVATSLLEIAPESAKARLFRIEVLVRQNESEEILAELQRPIELIELERLSDKLRISQFLLHFGFRERAAAYTYRLFIENRDDPRAWMALPSLIFDEKRSGDHDAWTVTAVTVNAAVDLKFDNDTTQFLVVEPDPHLRNLDVSSWEPDHPLLKTIEGLSEGDTFVLADGRKGVIARIRHKHIARLHEVLETYEARFPAEVNLQSVQINPKEPGGLDGLIEKAKARYEWITQEQNDYLSGAVPLGILALRLRLDTVEVAQGLAAQGIPLKVATGNQEEREFIASALVKNAGSGCALDLLTFWTAWTLKGLSVVEEVCGKIHLPQSVIDRLNARKERLLFSAKDGLKTAGYDGNQLTISEMPAAVIQSFITEIDGALEWITQHAKICPVIMTDEIPETMQRMLRSTPSDMFDSLLISVQRKIMLVSDDLPIRQLALSIGFDRSTNLHPVLAHAADGENIDFDTYIRWTAWLVEWGHSYLGVTGEMLARSCVLDAQDGSSPGAIFQSLSGVIGGANAELNSHVKATVQCFWTWWNDHKTESFRAKATGQLLENLIRGQNGDYQVILRAVRGLMRRMPQFDAYFRIWMRGHFIEI
jgi:cellulose synthase operon protein C